MSLKACADCKWCRNPKELPDVQFCDVPGFAGGDYCRSRRHFASQCGQAAWLYEARTNWWKRWLTILFATPSELYKDDKP